MLLAGGTGKCRFSIITERDFLNLSDTFDLSSDLWSTRVFEDWDLGRGLSMSSVGD